MADDGQPSDLPGDPPEELLEVARLTVGPWVRRTIERAARRGGVNPDDLDPDELDSVVGETAQRIVDDLEFLLAQDVDEQRTNPLTIVRNAVAEPTEFLLRSEIPPPPTDRFASERFPEDPYLLGPASWADIDDRLHGPGLVWGAWKAKVVLDRRRDEGMR